MLSRLRINMRRFLVALIMIVATIPLGLASADTGTWSNNTDDYKGVMISEILVSPNGEDYGGIDWNGDGVIGIDSVQYI